MILLLKENVLHIYFKFFFHWLIITPNEMEKKRSSMILLETILRQPRSLAAHVVFEHFGKTNSTNEKSLVAAFNLCGSASQLTNTDGNLKAEFFKRIYIFFFPPHWHCVSKL